ncbi:MAG: hypothetical protein DMF44_01495 [Verrucomicrobia bacterium]|nr:MAG: hypothetical protein DMF44_01495 [Verrucomicrobiota bacterium]
MTQPAKRSFKRELRVCYPAGTGTLVIRTDLDWERNVYPVALSSDGNTTSFEIEAHSPFVLSLLFQRSARAFPAFGRN